MGGAKWVIFKKVAPHGDTFFALKLRAIWPTSQNAAGDFHHFGEKNERRQIGIVDLWRDLFGHFRV